MSRLGMDAYTLHLLGMAVKACGPNGLDLRMPNDHQWRAGRWSEPRPINTYSHAGWGKTPTDALAALLRDLGVEVPERPTPERVAEIETSWPGPAAASAYQHHYRRDHADRLAVLALLEEGA